jgi:hypothetical protein
MEDVHDNRIPCPLCVFYGENVRFTSAKSFIGALYGRKLKIFSFAKTIEHHCEDKGCLKIKKTYLGEGMTLTRRRYCRHAQRILNDSSKGWFDRNRPLRDRLRDLGYCMLRVHSEILRSYEWRLTATR